MTPPVILLPVPSVTISPSTMTTPSNSKLPAMSRSPATRSTPWPRPVCSLRFPEAQTTGKKSWHSAVSGAEPARENPRRPGCPRLWSSPPLHTAGEPVVDGPIWFQLAPAGIVTVLYGSMLLYGWTKSESTTVRSCSVVGGLPVMLGVPCWITTPLVRIPPSLAPAVQSPQPEGWLLLPSISEVPDTVTFPFEVTAASMSTHGVTSLPTRARSRVARMFPLRSSFSPRAVTRNTPPRMKRTIRVYRRLLSPAEADRGETVGRPESPPTPNLFQTGFQVANPSVRPISAISVACPV